MLESQNEEAVEQAGPVFSPPVYLQRYATVKDILYKQPGIIRVVDFGCAEGKFFKYLKNLPFTEEIVGVDLSRKCLELSSRRIEPLAHDFVFKRHCPLSIKLFLGSVAEKDSRLQGFDAVTCIELIEHLEPEALELLPENVFGYIHPKMAIFTTPNSDFNVLFPKLQGFRHWDHKFEWNRKEFSDWCASITSQYPEYSVLIQGIGDPPPESTHLGSCTQMAVFSLSNKISSSALCQNLTDTPYTLVSESNYPGRDKTESCVPTNGETESSTLSSLEDFGLSDLF